ncbi:MAG: transporter substrate-binding domain-containing protein [Butyrivibrio sp.]|nr:transporter substrate-binding domain-containing protein [Butyrivibrio sp.]
MKRAILKRAVAALVVVGILTGCGSTKSDDASTAKAAESDGKRVISVAVGQNNYPVSYHDDNDRLTGYDVEALRLVEEKISDKYTFTWTEGAQDANYTGLSTGKYQIVLSNAFYTEERAQNFILTENPLGASPGGLVVRVEDKGVINTLEDAASAGYKAAPHLAGDGNTYLYQKYNAEHPDNPLDFDISDDPNAFSNGLAYVAEGRYDCIVFPGIYFDALVTQEDGAYHEYADKLYYNEYIPISTYAVVAKGEDELAADINKALGELREEGKLSELAVQFYGYDTWSINDQQEGN